MQHPVFTIKENSWLARIAAFNLGASTMAIVFGSTIHLYNTTSDNFLKNKKWVNHELCHVKQFQEHGFILFIVKYLWESIRNGYDNNRFEVEARQAEQL